MKRFAAVTTCLMRLAIIAVGLLVAYELHRLNSNIEAVRPEIVHAAAVAEEAYRTASGVARQFGVVP